MNLQSDLVFDLKVNFWCKQGIIIEKFDLVFEGRLLKGDQKLSYYGIEQDSMIDQILSIRPTNLLECYPKILFLRTDNWIRLEFENKKTFAISA